MVGTAALFYTAWKSGEHHADRAKRIVEKNRLDRKVQWRKQEREIVRLKDEVKLLRALLSKANNRRGAQWKLK